MFTHVRVSGCSDLEYRTWAYCRRADVSLMLLSCRWARISYGMLSGRDVESACNKMEGMCEGGLWVVRVRVANKWPCFYKMCML